MEKTKEEVLVDKLLEKFDIEMSDWAGDMKGFIGNKYFHISERELFVLSERGKGRKLKDIGGKLNITVSRVMQIRDCALVKLRLKEGLRAWLRWHLVNYTRTIINSN